MKNYIFGLAILLISLISCGSNKVIVPEGTPPEVAHLMTEYYLQLEHAEILVDAFKHQSGLNKYKLENISSVYLRTVGGEAGSNVGVNKVLSVRVGNSSEIIINLD